MDLAEVAQIHTHAFPESLITKLGTECIIQYYKWQFESPDKVYAIGAFLDTKMLGFCFGGVFSVALGGFLIRNKSLIIKRLIICPWILFHPAFVRRILRGFSLVIKFSFFKGNISKEPAVTNDSHFGILAIASDPTARGLGVGNLLMSNSEQYAKENNLKKMFLSVNPKNVNAIQFYEHIGWVRVGDKGNWAGKMQKVIIND